MEHRQSWSKSPLPKIGLALWFVLHIMANLADLVPTLPGLSSSAEWEEPRFRDEWKKWQELRGEEAEETRDWWLTNARQLAETQATIRAPFGWYLDSLGFSQQWDLFRAGTRLAPQFEVRGKICRSPSACETTLLFRYGDGGVLAQSLENVRMRGQVFSWAAGPASASFADGCRTLASHIATTLDGLQAIRCALTLIPTPTPMESSGTVMPYDLQSARILLQPATDDHNASAEAQ